MDGGEKKGCMETCSVKDGGYYGGQGKDASTHGGAESTDSGGAGAGGTED